MDFQKIRKSVTKNFTSPVILQGKIRSTKSLQARETWYVEFYIDGKRHRKSEGLNRIKIYNEKLLAFTELRDAYQKKLESGELLFNNDPQNFRATKPNVKKLIKEFLQYQHDKGSRPKTIQSYASKLIHIDKFFGKNLVEEIQSNHMLKLLATLSKSWQPKTYNNCKLIFSSFFEYCKMEGHIEKNPVSRIKGKYVPKTKIHKVFKDDDFKLLMSEVEKDPMLSLFVKSIYYTCIRPKELTQLQLKHIDFARNLIFVPADISKNKKDGYVNICSNYRKLLEPFVDVEEDYFMFTTSKTIFGVKPFHTNHPYKKLKKIFQKLNLDDKGYTMYSFKHFSNVKKFLAGWSLAEIMKANRHASIEETENYLKDLLDFVDISEKEVPSI
ncbi:tyrosine-type recombinase/integrase [Sphingobacterium mizutaii]|uniref:tyrosine-type recombinase/integrase n=1 Tax=Sphingobacterium mizutaii TaxID=1010 RepID=UPI0016268C21|nr:site-specific integrase [Sphingobacterium mizutaii]